MNLVDKRITELEKRVAELEKATKTEFRLISLEHDIKIIKDYLDCKELPKHDLTPTSQIYTDKPTYECPECKCKLWGKGQAHTAECSLNPEPPKHDVAREHECQDDHDQLSCLPDRCDVCSNLVEKCTCKQEPEDPIDEVHSRGYWYQKGRDEMYFELTKDSITIPRRMVEDFVSANKNIRPEQVEILDFLRQSLSDKKSKGGV